MSSTSVLFDAPGPRARRNSLLWSALAIAVLAAIFFVLGRRLFERGQFDSELWTPFLDPGHENFPAVWRVVREGLLANARAAVLAMIFSLSIGTVLALSRVTLSKRSRWAVISTIELFRGIPVVIAIFFAARALPSLGVDLSTMWYLVIGLTAYNSVVIAEIIRAGLNAVPRGQSEAASAIGLNRGQSLRIVLLPQAIRIMLPALISQMVVVFKDTALGFIIAYEDLGRSADRIGTDLDNPLQSWFVAAVIFITINMTLGWVAVRLERRLSRSSQRAAKVAEVAGDATTGA
jgi:glutamate transport system permease protein